MINVHSLRLQTKNGPFRAMLISRSRGTCLIGKLHTALPREGKGDHPNELDLAEVQIQVSKESKGTFDFD